MKELGVGVIGAGFMGNLHARVYSQIPGVKVLGVADFDRERAQGLAEDVQARAYTNYEDLLADEDIRAVSICVSDPNHLKPAVAAAQAGKEILLEKPIALVEEEANAIIEACRQNNVKLMIGFLLRFSAHYGKVKEEIDGGRIGEIVHIYTRRNSPKCEGPARYGSEGDLTFHVVIHDIDMLLWYVGQPVERVYAEGVSKALKHLGILDSACAVIRFANGAVANLEYSWALPENSPTLLDSRLELVGTQGMASIELGNQGLFICSEDGRISYPDTVHWPELRGTVMGDLRDEILHFVDCVQNDKEPLITGEDGLKALQVASAIKRSLSEGKVVHL